MGFGFGQAALKIDSDIAVIDDIRKVASLLGQGAEEILDHVPDEYDAAVVFLRTILKTSFRERTVQYQLGAKTPVFAIFCLYKLLPWRDNNEKSFRHWCNKVELSSEETAFMLALIREFGAWEPALPEDYARLIKLDRAIVRSARVGAYSMNIYAFVVWLSRNVGNLANKESLLMRVNQLVRRIEFSGSAEEENSPDKLELIHIAERVLLEVGEQHGRAGLNSVRRQIGSPPSARRPATAVIGAVFTPQVYNLAQNYISLSPSEREAFKAMLNQVDKGKLMESRSA